MPKKLERRLQAEVARRRRQGRPVRDPGAYVYGTLARVERGRRRARSTHRYEVRPARTMAGRWVVVDYESGGLGHPGGRESFASEAAARAWVAGQGDPLFTGYRRQRHADTPHRHVHGGR